MRISHVLAFAATLSAATSAFAGPSIPPSESNTVTVQAAANRAHKLTADEAAGMDGVFQLADGRTLTLTHRHNKVFAQIDGKREELLPVSENRFVSRDTGARLTFNQAPFSEQVVLNQAAH